MANLILHVGLHKTGTSALQKSLHQNSAKLFECGYFYPKPDSQDAHHGLVSLLRIHSNGNLVQPSGKEDFLRKLEEFKTLADGRNIIISSELFSEPVSKQVIANLREMFDNVRIVLYLRRQDTLLESVHNQVLKQNAVHCENILKATLYPYDLTRSIAKWSGLFGEENLIVRRFEKSKLYKGDIFLDFLNAIDFQLDTDWLDLKASHVNESLSMIEFMVLDRLSGAGMTNWSNVVEITQKLAREQYGGHDCRMVGGYLTYEQRIAFLKTYEESNAKILMKFFPDDNELFSSPTRHADSVNDPALLRDVSSAFVDVLRELAIRAAAKAATAATTAIAATDASAAAAAAAAAAATEAASATAAAVAAATDAANASALAAKAATEMATEKLALENQQRESTEPAAIAAVESVQATADTPASVAATESAQAETNFPAAGETIESIQGSTNTSGSDQSIVSRPATGNPSHSIEATPATTRRSESNESAESDQPTANRPEAPVPTESTPAATSSPSAAVSNESVQLATHPVE
jgi:hypothetical protein